MSDLAGISLSRDPSIPLAGNTHLLRWVEKMRELTRPAAVHWVDGSQREYDALCAQLVRTGTLTKLNEELWPGCYRARSDASDVARVEQRTLVCSLSREAAGPNHNWVNPDETPRTPERKCGGARAAPTTDGLACSKVSVAAATTPVGL